MELHSKNISVSSCGGSGKNQLIFYNAVQQEPVGFNMTFAEIS